MPRFLLHRPLQSLVSLWALVSVVFLLSRLIGDPTVTLMPLEASRADQEALKAQYGLDRPLYEQYGIFLWQAVNGDLGDAFFWRRPVAELVWSRLPASLLLIGTAMAIAIAFAIVAGVYAAVWRGGRFDLLMRSLATIGGSIPSFWLGMVLIMVFAVWMGALPVSGLDQPTSIILPAVTLAWAVSGNILRLTRSAMLEVLGSDYIKLARIKGVPERRVVWRHALKNALLPVATYTASITARLLGAAIVVETVFAWPGLGRLLIQAVTVRDFPVIQGVVFILGSFQIALTIALDILYVYLNPKIRFS